MTTLRGFSNAIRSQAPSEQPALRICSVSATLPIGNFCLVSIEVN